MLSPTLYKNSHAYDFFIRLLGYESSIDRFLRDLDVSFPPQGRILDSGCGTGLLGLHFLQRFPESTLIATDLEPNFLQATAANAQRRNLASERVTLGIANISAPQHVTDLQGNSYELQEASFNLICVGAVLGYADDTEASIRHLLRLLAPGGHLINLEMNERMVGRFVSRRYHYDNIQIDQMQAIIREEGYQVLSRELGIKHLPAKLTRTAIIVKKVA